VDEHEDELVRVAGRVEQENRERQEADTRQDAERERLRGELKQRIDQAAAVGLGREFAGTLLVLVGLVVVVIGIVL
jgi:hypothetical protein